MSPRPSRRLVDALAEVGVTLEEELAAEKGRGRWSGRSDRHGDGPVLVTIGRTTSRVHMAGLRARVGAIVALQDAGLAPVVEAVPCGSDLVVVHRDVPGTDLATVLLGRADWRAGEVLGVVHGLFRALAALHRAGLTHGDVSPANTVLGPDGAVLLVDLVHGCDATERGTDGWAAPERPAGATPAADVHAAGRIGLELVRRVPPGGAGDVDLAAVRELLTRAAARQAEARPDAAAVVRGLATAGPEEPVVPFDAAAMARAALRREGAADPTRRTTQPGRGRHRRRGVPRGVLVPAVVGCVALGAGTGVVQHVTGTAPTAATASPTGTSDTSDTSGTSVAVGTSVGTSGPVAVPLDVAGGAERAASGLTRLRAAAVGRGDGLRLLSVTATGSSAAGADRALLAAGPQRPRAQTDVTLLGDAVRADDGSWHVPVRVSVRAPDRADDPDDPDDTGAGDAVQEVGLRLVLDGARWVVSDIGDP